MKLKLTINRKMLIYVLGVAAVIYAGALGYIGMKLYNVSKNNAIEIAKATAAEYSGFASQNMSKYNGVVSTLGAAFDNIGQVPEANRRSYTMKIMEQIMIENPDILSVWSIWEPNTIDALDSSYIGMPGSTYIGSFSPGFYRENNEIKLEENGSTELFQGQYFVDVKSCECPLLIEPYYYSYNGSNGDSVLQTNLVLPIFKDYTFQGVVGIDIPLSKIQEEFRNINTLESGEIYFVSNKGTVVTCNDSTKIGQPLESILPGADASYQVLENIEKGKAVEFYNKNTILDAAAYMLFQPIKAGDVDTPWSFCVAIPKKDIFYQSTKSLLNIVFITAVGLFILSLVIGLFARSVSRPLIKITKALHNLSAGNINLDEKVSYKINDEIGDLAKSVNGLFDGLNSAAKFAGEIGNGNLQAEYKLLSHSDELGNSLLEMQKSLIVAREEEEKKKIEDDNRNWVTHGLAQFGEIIRKDNDDMVKFSSNVVNELVSYMNVAQVGLFISEKDQYGEREEEFVLKAAMAYGKPVMFEKRIQRGHEMLGRAVDENKLIHLKGLPQEYVEISPGIKSEKRPDNLLISPLTVNDVTYGVIEILSYDPYLAHHIDFIEKLSENVASVISSVNTNIQTAKLLEQSQHQADELAQHEEEMRQNLEEMQATQEEASKREADLSSVLKTVQKSFLSAELDLTGRVMDMSPAMLIAYNVTLDQVKGKYYNAFVAQTEELRVKFAEFWEDLVRNGKGRRRHEVKQRNKKIVYIEEYTVVEQEGVVPRVLLVSIDRSQQDMLSKELKKEQDKIR